MKATVLMFDDLLQPGLMRLGILTEVLQAHGIEPYTDAARPVLDTLAIGRTFEECVRRGWATDARVQHDPTLLELVPLEANLRYAGWLRDGARLIQACTLLLDGYAESGSRRLILRADASRRDVVPFLERWALHDRFALIRCADDPPIEGSIYRSSYCRSWEAIRARLTRWGIDRTAVDVRDQCDDTKMVALQLLSGTPVNEVGY